MVAKCSKKTANTFEPAATIQDGGRTGASTAPPQRRHSAVKEQRLIQVVRALIA